MINALISRFCDSEARVRWRAVAAAGAVTGGLAETEPESARVIMRRLMWMLNDESGGIGWGAPEAMGETMAASPALAAEYSGILCSYIRPDQNFLEHPGLQRGVLWGLGRLAQAEPGRVRPAVGRVLDFLESGDAQHRGLAAWAAGNTCDPAAVGSLQRLFADEKEIDFFEHWHIRRVAVGELARQAAARLAERKGE